MKLSDSLSPTAIRDRISCTASRSWPKFLAVVVAISMSSWKRGATKISYFTLNAGDFCIKIKAFSFGVVVAAMTPLKCWCMRVERSRLPPPSTTVIVPCPSQTINDGLSDIGMRIFWDLPRCSRHCGDILATVSGLGTRRGVLRYLALIFLAEVPLCQPSRYTSGRTGLDKTIRISILRWR